jgi:hypothetical protein
MTREKTVVAAARSIKTSSNKNKGTYTAAVILLPVACQGKVTVTLRYDSDTI